MFDTITGLPLHPLVVHSVVVLGPLAALLLLAYVLVPRWRVGLRWPTLGLAVSAAVAAKVAEESGAELEDRIGDPGFEHADKGELAVLSLIVLAVAVLVVVLIVLKPATRGSARRFVAAVLALLAGGFALFGVYDAGHSGASSVWKGQISGSSAGTAEGDDSSGD